jgi:phosphohistidine swiveling domain-containing protein
MAAASAVPAAASATEDGAAPRSGPRRERATDGTVLAADPAALKRALDAVEAELRRGGEALRERLVLVRYLIGTIMLPLVSWADPFAFLKPGASETGADGGLGALLERSYALEEALDRLGPTDGGTKPSSGSPGASEEASRDGVGTAGATGETSARQLIGIPSVPGQASGRAVRPRARGGEPGGSRPILVCDRYSRGLVEAYPDAAAVVEREGGRIGLGARLARSVGIPCVSGVPDLARIPEGAELMVDGELGIVTVATGAAG